MFDSPIYVIYRIEEAHILRYHQSDANLYLPQGESVQLMHQFAVAVEMGWPIAAGLCVQLIWDALIG